MRLVGPVVHRTIAWRVAPRSPKARGLGDELDPRHATTAAALAAAAIPGAAAGGAVAGAALAGQRPGRPQRSLRPRPPHPCGACCRVGRPGALVRHRATRLAAPDAQPDPGRGRSAARRGGGARRPAHRRARPVAGRAQRTGDPPSRRGPHRPGSGIGHAGPALVDARGRARRAGANPRGARALRTCRRLPRRPKGARHAVAGLRGAAALRPSRQRRCSVRTGCARAGRTVVGQRPARRAGPSAAC